MRVNVETGSRLHFGLLCPAPEQRWHYGGIGLMIKDPGCQLSLATRQDGSSDQLHVDAAIHDRIQTFLEHYRNSAASKLPPVKVTSHRPIPLHSGLGTGTQLTLALAAGCRVLSGQGISRDITAMARQYGRSRRSAVGTMGFVKGGFQIDYGRYEDRVDRVEFPEAWRLVLIRPKQTAGLSGESEESFFGTRKPLSQTTLQQLVHLIEKRIVPSLESCQFDEFASGLQEYGDLAGADFAEEQGGLFSSPAVRDILNQLESELPVTAVQSSWGPTVCLPTDSETTARQLVHQLEAIIGDSPIELLITSARNEGATIRSDGDIVQRALG